MSLTALEVKSITCPEDKKQIKKFDGNGLFLLIKSNGSKLWRMRFKLSGKHKEMALGQYPMIPLVEARKLAEEARVLLIQGISPIDERRERKRNHSATDRQFHAIALDWWELQKDSWSSEHKARVKRFISIDCKSLTKLLIDEIDAGHITDLPLKM